MNGEDQGRGRRERFLYCLKVFLALRIGLMVLGFLAIAVIPARDLVSVPGWADRAFAPGLHNLFTAFEKQDALWFLRIATGGYRVGDGSAAFFPLYPLAIRGVSFVLGGRPLAAALLVSNLSFLGALFVLYSLTASEFSDAVARKTVLFICVFPTSFFFLAPYSESLFLLLSLTSFWAARKGKWWLAGTAGAGAALTRSAGILLVPALAVEAVHQWRKRGSGLAGRLVWSGVPALGTLSYLAWWQVRAGNWKAPLEFQANWDRHPAFPLTTLVKATAAAWNNGSYWLLDWLVVVPVLAVAVYAVFKLRPSYSVYSWACIIAPLCLVWDTRPLMSMSRFVVVIFPAFWGLALLVENRRISRDLVVAVGAAGLALMAVLFVNAYFVF